MFGTGRPLIFLAGALALALLFEGVIRLIEGLIEDTPLTTAYWYMFLGIVALFLLGVAFNPWRMLVELFRPSRQASVSEVGKVERRRGLIAIVSTGLGTSVVAEGAIAHHALVEPPGSPKVLEHCYLIIGPGEGEGSSSEHAKRLKREYKGQGVEVHLHELEQSDNIGEMFQKVKHIYDLARSRDGIEAQEIIADYTGGTKTMTAGMVLAVAAMGGELQYMKPNAYKSNGYADPAAGSKPVLVKADFVAVSELGDMSL